MSLLLHRAPATPVTLRLPVHTGGLTLTQASNGDLSLTDPAGRLVARAPAPRMCAASLNAHSGLADRCAAVPSTLATGPAGQELDVTLDQAWLTDPATVYPVTVYPVTVDPATNLTDNLDDPVPSMFPTTNYEGTSELHVGTYNEGADKNRSYQRINTTAIKGKTVTAAAMHADEVWSRS